MGTYLTFCLGDGRGKDTRGCGEQKVECERETHGVDIEWDGRRTVKVDIAVRREVGVQVRTGRLVEERLAFKYVSAAGLEMP